MTSDDVVPITREWQTISQCALHTMFSLVGQKVQSALTCKECMRDLDSPDCSIRSLIVSVQKVIAKSTWQD
jgi:hypothetical protein